LGACLGAWALSHILLAHTFERKSSAPNKVAYRFEWQGRQRQERGGGRMIKVEIVRLGAQPAS
jgi:hypothetical protein